MSTQTDTMNAASPPPRFDFPTWLPAMFVKELRQGLRTRGFVGSMVGFQVVMVIAFVWAFAANVFGESQALRTVNGFFWGILAVMLLVVMPLRAMAGLRQEIDAKTLDLLMLTHLTGWRIVLGKWTSLLAQAALLLLAVLPYGVVRYFFGAVDLVQDFYIIALMYMGCGLLTAVGLWVSGLPRILRIGIPLVLFFLSQGVFGNGFYRLRYGLLSGSPSGLGSDWWVAVPIFDGILLLVFFLVLAVRRIAPPAENHSPMVRGLGLLTLLPVPLLYVWGSGSSPGEPQMWFAVLSLGVVSVIEISSLRLPMAVQVRTWWRRGWWGRLAGRFVLPGWPSAALFTLFWLALATVGARMGLIEFSAGDANGMTRVFMLLWTALVFPMLLLSFMPRIGRQAPLVYFIIQAVFGILCIMEGNTTQVSPVNPLVENLRWLLHVFPVTSFWLEAAAQEVHPYHPYRFMTGQAVVMALVFLAALWRMMFYWRWVRMQALTLRREKTVPAE